MEIIDARGLECPLPVVKTKEALKKESAVKTIVDNEIAVQNLKKFAQVKGYQYEVNQEDKDFSVVLYQGEKPVETTEEKNKDVVVFSSNVMGSNKELGAILMKAFIFALTKQDSLPSQMIFYNEGVLLTSNDSEMLKDIQWLESQGVEVVSCGTCLDFFHKKEELKVGSVTNMYDIVERMEKATKIIKP
ncbi:MAG: sulfurtransferase-like selenium metabolism protein YedF [Erysipelotrichaceae bacterium]|uniref:sulfurtransferase-like selenium metabolism protein YedF n=1 Tax=Floccifex sp. TaxID=2815810 RepID=UPI002A760A08|nr:sulfurtransferase-like selenium metabolism protein YedF [Floccifex sp.]MDD7281374.1 sulfurtransferase-like selenium metabolism protein YedF [Erysipelotrichaceae bacterium]MDY2958887.1 sulfurtransferase-like selenium metabolism protein YedF [Floccifex sp.]